jgi:uncharacterized repeat protein (TIGR01451 family)
VKDTIPAGATLLTTDQIVTRATFTFTNSSGPVVNTYSVTDTTTVASPGPSVTVSGTVYNDINSNGILDGGETGANMAGVYAKIFYASNLASALSVTSVVQATGAYSFVSVPTNTTYVIILSSTNNTNYDPSFPSVQWIYTSPVNYTLTSVIVGGANLTNQNFGVFNGTRIDGKVLQDDGAATGSNANNGVQNAGEPGIAGQTMSVCDNSSCTSISTAVTDANGAYSLFVPWATNFATARVTQTTMPAGDIMVTYNPGTALGSAANLGNRYVTFTFTRGTDITGLVHSDVLDNTFTPTPLAQNGAQTAQVYYAHTFMPGTGGTASFAPILRSQPTWSAVIYYQDNNCNGSFDAGDTLIAGSIATTKGTPICILVKDTILATAPTGTTDQIVTQATFTFTNSYGPLVGTDTVTDTTTVVTPNFTTSTKTWTDLSGGPGGNNVYPGDVMQFTITLINSTATATALSVQVTDTLSANLSTLLVVSIPAGATDFSTSTTLDVRNITVSPSSSVTIIFNASVSGAVGGSITNTANILLPLGGGPTVISMTPTPVTIVATSGNKPLYVYGGGASPYQMSRTPTPGTPTTAAIANGGGSAVWNESPVLQLNDTITAVNLALYINGSSNNARNVEVRLYCSSNAAVYASWGPANLGTNPPIPPANPTLYNFALAGNLPMTCTANSSNTWVLQVFNRTANAGRTITVVPVFGANISRTELTSQNVISVSSVNSYIATYPSTTAPASGYFSGGQAVYVRAVVSDPFGSFDIVSVPTVTIKDPSNNVVVSNAAMTLKIDSGQATKTFEYAYTVPVTGPAGIWTATVTAKEGTENTVSDTGVGTFRVMLLPNITVVKSSSVISDPINGVSASAKAIPGAEVQYTIQVINSGNGVADADSIVITDPVPANTTMYVDTTGSAVTLTCGGCGLTDPWTYANAVSYSYQSGGGPPYVYPPTTIGYDPLVKGVRITPSGTLNGSGASFTVIFKMKIK